MRAPLCKSVVCLDQGKLGLILKLQLLRWTPCHEVTAGVGVCKVGIDPQSPAVKMDTLPRGHYRGRCVQSGTGYCRYFLHANARRLVVVVKIDMLTDK